MELVYKISIHNDFNTRLRTIAPYNQKNLMNLDNLYAKDKQESRDNVNKIQMKEALEKTVHTKYSQNELLTNNPHNPYNQKLKHDQLLFCNLFLLNHWPVQIWRYNHIIIKPKYLEKQSSQLQSRSPYFKPFLSVEPMDLASLIATRDTARKLTKMKQQEEEAETVQKLSQIQVFPSPALKTTATSQERK